MSCNVKHHNMRPAVTRRAVLQVGLAALASRFTSMVGSYLEWLLRWCLIDTRLAVAG